MPVWKAPLTQEQCDLAERVRVKKGARSLAKLAVQLLEEEGCRLGLTAENKPIAAPQTPIQPVSQQITHKPFVYQDDDDGRRRWPYAEED